MIRRLAREEDGFALLLALGLTVVLSIMVVSIISYTTSNQRGSTVSRAQVTALSVAEAGIQEATSIINHASNASTPTILGCSADSTGTVSVEPCTDLTVTADGGTASFHGLFSQDADTSTGIWTITSYGTAPNPNGGNPLSKWMTAEVTISGGGQTNNISVWNYVYATGGNGTGCDVDLSGTNTIIDVPLYVTGDLCLSGTNSSIVENTTTGQPVDVRVGGTVTVTGQNSSVGLSTAPITSGLAAGGCITPSHPTAHVCRTYSDDPWYVKATDQPLTATPPTTDFPTWYQNASPGPKHPCDSTLTKSAPMLAASTFDTNTTMDGTDASFNLTPSTSYYCVTSSGTLSWNATTKLLTVSGTIFFDGDVTETAAGAMYHGKATIYVNGVLHMNSTSSSLRAGCPASPATPTAQCNFSDTKKYDATLKWDPNSDLIIFITNKPGATAADLSGTDAEFQGGIYCSDTSTIDLSGTNTKVEGPIICGKFKWFTNTSIVPLPTISNLPPGAPLPPNAKATISPPQITGTS